MDVDADAEPLPGHADHPELILMCDDCEGGWHASCLRPSLMVIPEGDWSVQFFSSSVEFSSLSFPSSSPLSLARFCPPCNHKSLVSSLGSKLEELDVLLKKTEAERRRKERLAFVNQSLAKSVGGWNCLVANF